MQYNLTENQKELARWIFREHRKQRLPEVFDVSFVSRGIVIGDRPHLTGTQGKLNFSDIKAGSFEALAAAQLLRVSKRFGKTVRVEGSSLFSNADTISFTILGQLQTAIAANFEDQATPTIQSPLVQSHPPEITMSLARLRERFPDQKTLGFLVMRFVDEKPYAEIVAVIQRTATQHGLTVVRADSHEFHSDLLSNVRTYLHGCGFGIAIYERIQTDEPNANIGLEVGYLMAMNKPVLLLKDKTARILQTDLAGKLYKAFDPHDAEATIPPLLTKWLEDYGIVLGTPK